MPSASGIALVAIALSYGVSRQRHNPAEEVQPAPERADSEALWHSAESAEVHWHADYFAATEDRGDTLEIHFEGFIPSPSHVLYGLQENHTVVSEGDFLGALNPAAKTVLAVPAQARSYEQLVVWDNFSSEELARAGRIQN